MENCCCLCVEVLGLDHRRRKKLHGFGCTSAKAVLEEVIFTMECVYPPALQDGNALLCHTCELRLNNIKKAENQIMDMRDTVKCQQSKLSYPSKRTLSCSQVPQAKQMKVTSEAELTAGGGAELTAGTSAELTADDGAELTADDGAQLTAGSGAELTAGDGAELTAVRDAMNVSREVGNKEAASKTQSSSVQIQLGYRSGTQCYCITTPSRKKCVRKLARRSYFSMEKTVVNSPIMCSSVITKIIAKIKAEMKKLCTQERDSILRDTIEAVKQFHWDTVMIELEQNMPTLMHFLKQLVAKSNEKKPFLCFLASQILKSCNMHMGLVQRAVSIMLYGNGTSKEVYRNLQPLNVCLSYRRTKDLVELISEDHAIEVEYWNQLVSSINVSAIGNLLGSNIKVHYSSTDLADSEELSNSGEQTCPDDICDDMLGWDADDLDGDIQAPSFSPISSINELSSNSESTLDTSLGESTCSNELIGQECAAQSELQCIAMSGPSLQADTWFGYKFVGDNIDKNIKPRFQRQDSHTGHSLHYFHGYAVRDT